MSVEKKNDLTVTKSPLGGTLVIFVTILCITNLILISSSQKTNFDSLPQWASVIRIIGIIPLLFTLIIGLRASFGFVAYKAAGVLIIILGILVWLEGEVGEQKATNLTYIGSFFIFGLLFLRIPQERGSLNSGLIYSLRIVVWGSCIFAAIHPQWMFRAGQVRLDALDVGFRFSGIIGDANTMGFFALILFVISFWRRPKYWKVDTFLILIVLLLGQSRFAILGLIVAFLVLRRGQIRTKFSALALIMSVVTTMFLLIVSISTPVSEASIRGTDLLNARPLIWHWAVNAWRGSEFFGIRISKYYDYLAASPGFWVHTHNQWLQYLLIGGYMTLTGMIFVFAFLAKGAFDSLRIEQNPLPITLLTCLVLYSTVEVPLFVDSLNFRLLGAIILFLGFAPNGGEKISSGVSKEPERNNVKSKTDVSP